MEDLTFTEAKERIAQVEQDLAALHINPYAVGDVNCEEFSVMEMCPPIYTSSGNYVTVDIAHETVQLGKYVTARSSDWDYMTIMALRCGLVARESPSIKARIAFWKWEDPATWEKERLAWRTSQMASMDAVKLDEYHVKVNEHSTLKRKWDRVASSFADNEERLAKKQRTDDEVLAERNQGVPLPSEDEEDI